MAETELHVSVPHESESPSDSPSSAETISAETLHQATEARVEVAEATASMEALEARIQDLQTQLESTRAEHGSTRSELDSMRTAHESSLTELRTLRDEMQNATIGDVTPVEEPEPMESQEPPRRVKPMWAKIILGK